MKQFVKICCTALAVCMILSLMLCAFAAEQGDAGSAGGDAENKWGNPKSYLFPTLVFAFGIGGGMAIGGAMNRRGRK